MYRSEVIRMVETLNLRAIELRNSDIYAAGIRAKKINQLIHPLNPSHIHDGFQSWLRSRRFAHAPRHEEQSNLDPIAWEKSLCPGSGTKKVVVYSCITGGYDIPLEPLMEVPQLDYVMFLSATDTLDSTKWDIRPIPTAIQKLGNNTLINRYIKLHPHELFENDYDVAIYIDGNVQAISDLSYYADIIHPQAGIALHYHRTRSSIADEVIACSALGKGSLPKMQAQVNAYRERGFPTDYGLLECNIIAVDLHSDLSKKLISEWWKEYCYFDSGRDQLALPYVLWKNNIPIERVATMGYNAYRDSKVFIKNHDV
ncbi:glycosyltransferase domain-containing protein [Olegusella massiliensis]|uniref:glycosyltransferase domain-containing protein n=1 Tax=Olegusella massiliensis TaxID=1776381 RepID=UPI0008390503|nr:glycosyltransferase domain-containing protein [Olegusella massiliensis]